MRWPFWCSIIAQKLARSAGLDCDHGIIVDRQLRSSDPNIYALGDCIQIDGRLLPARRAFSLALEGPRDPVLAKGSPPDQNWQI